MPTTAERQRELRAQAKANGICTRCRARPATTGLSCSECVASAKRRVAARRTKDVCSRCLAKPRTATCYCDECDAYVRNYTKRKKEPGRCSGCGRKHADGVTTKLCEQCKGHARDHHNRLREAAIVAYGGKCKCCGDTHKEFLQVDHVNNDGASERRRKGWSSAQLYRKLKNANYPKGYQLLCANCNYAKSIYGYCPHHPDKVTNPAPRRKGQLHGKREAKG